MSFPKESAHRPTNHSSLAWDTDEAGDSGMRIPKKMGIQSFPTGKQNEVKLKN